ncbi:MAG: hypothetical protein M1819_004095 [Sarea resinae]|nr:MAG: hypothetical protein M1819_004095 [Sarea resinae]
MFNGFVPEPGQPMLAEPIAIVGMGCRWPGSAVNPSAFWDMLSEKRSAHSDFPSNRFNIDAFYHPNRERPGSLTTKGGYFIQEDPRLFDPAFFGINPREAATLDPAQRKILEVVYEALESAGATLESISGSSTGCFMGNFNHDHLFSQIKDSEYTQPYTATSAIAPFLSNRISYVFNLTGPSLTVDTACSASLYALHLACSSLQSGESAAAIVGASNLILTPDMQMFLDKLGALSPTSQCHTFESSADGYGRADGFGVFYLKRLSDAVRDRDPIRSVIRATAVNANGKNSGITHPSPSAQEAAMRLAYARAGNINPDMTGYYECHGTGTPVGDPLELSGISKVFSSGRTLEKPLLIGSVKTNLGHSEASSGLAGLMKAVLAIEKGVIPPSVGAENLNPKIDFENNMFHIVKENSAWPPHIPFRRASVASSGFGGANAHVIVEGVESFVPNYGHGNRLPALSAKSDQPDCCKGDQQYLLPFSAHDRLSLAENIEALRSVASQYSILDLSYTLGMRRSKFLHRAFAVSDQQNLSSSLDQNSVTNASAVVTDPPSLGFIFTGQGAQWAGMGKELLQRFPVFKKTLEILDRVLRLLDDPPQWKFEDILLAPPETSTVNIPEISQPICTALQIGLVELLASWGIKPVATMGHSSGELGAAYSAGIITGEEAIVAAYYRGKLVEEVTIKGSMAAIGLGREDVKAYLEDHKDSVTIAAVNSPQSVTLSGDPDAVQLLTQKLTAEGIFARQLHTGGKAYHSFHMKEISGSYESVTSEGLKRVVQEPPLLRRPLVTFYSSVLGKRFQGSGLDATYWRENLESPVLFTDALDELVTNQELPVDMLVEIGPHSALAGPIRQLEAKHRSEGSGFPAYASCLSRRKNAETTVLQLAGALFTRCVPLNFEEINATIDTETGDAIQGMAIPDLPTYRFQHKTISFYENRIDKEYRQRKFPRHDILGSRLPGCSPRSPVWRNILRVQDVPWFEDCKVLGSVTLSPACFIAMAIEAVTQLHTQKQDARAVLGIHLATVTFEDALILDSSEGVDVVTHLQEQSIGLPSVSHAFEIVSVQEEKAVLHCHGFVTVEETKDVLASSMAFEAPRALASTAWYNRFASLGLEYGPAFQALADLSTNPIEGEASAKLPLLPRTGRPCGESLYNVHPTVIDACVQLGLIAAKGGEPRNVHNLVRPVTMSRLFIRGSNVSPSDDAFASAMAWGEREESGTLTARIQLLGATGEVIMDIGSVVAEPVKSSKRMSSMNDIPFTQAVWKPDFTKLKLEQARSMFPPPIFEAAELFRKTEQAAITMLIQFFTEISTKIDPTKLDIGLGRFWNWIHRTVERADAGEIPFGREAFSLDASKREALIERLCAETEPLSIEAKLLKRMYDNLEPIFQGEASAHEVLMRDQLLPKLYTNSSTASGSMTQLRRVIDLIGHKSPESAYLEIGGGTGGATREILDTLGGKNLVRRYGSYTFTDVSSYFLSGAREEFKEYDGLKYATVDIERDVEEQGFAKASYDVVIAANVLHATTTMKETLIHVRSLLKPGGKLVLIETTIETVWLAIVLGGFSDYWKGTNDGRASSPFMIVEKWKNLLLETGFTQPEINLDDYMEPSRTMNVLVSTAVEIDLHVNGHVDSKDDTLVLVYRSQPTPIAKVIEKYANEKGIPTCLVPLSACTTPPKRAIILAELEGSFLSSMTEDEYCNLQRLSQSAESIVWVTSADLLAEHIPDPITISGLAKAVKAQNPSIAFSVFEVDPDSSLDQEAAEQVIDEVLCLEIDSEAEIATRNGVLHIKRILPFIGQYQLDTSKPEFSTELTEITSKNSQGVLDLGPDEVDVELKTVGLCSEKDMDQSFRLSLSGECTGTIIRTGENVSSLKEGDKVFALSPSRWGPRAKFQQQSLQLLEAEETLEKMTTLPLAYCSALYLIKHVARLSEGDNLFIHALPEELLLPMTLIAKRKGARVFVSSSIKLIEKEDLAEHLNVASEDILSLGEPSFVKEALRLTQKNGFDIIISSESENWTDALSDVVAQLGLVVRIAEKTKKPSELWNRPEDRNLALVTLDMPLLIAKKPKIFSSLLSEVFSMYREGSLMIPEPTSSLHVSALGDINEAWESGKKVLRLDDEHFNSLVTASLFYLKSSEHSDIRAQDLPTFSEIRCHSEKCYVLLHCLETSFGRGTALYLAEKGARDILFISDPSAISLLASSVEKYLTTLSALGVNVSLIESMQTEEVDLKCLLERCEKGVGGVIQGSPVLEDASFTALSNAQFQGQIQMQLHELDLLYTLLKQTPQQPQFVILLGRTDSLIGTTTNRTLDPILDSIRESTAQKWNAEEGLNTRFVALGSVSDPVASSGAGINSPHGEVDQEREMTAEEYISPEMREEFISLLPRIIGSQPSKPNAEFGATTVTPQTTLYMGLDPTRPNFPALASLSPTTAETNTPTTPVPNLRALSTLHLAFHTHQTSSHAASSTNATGNTSASLIDTLASLDRSSPQYAELATSAITEQLATLLFVAPEAISPKKALAAYGLDSMIAALFRGFLRQTFGLAIGMTELLGEECSIEGLVGSIREGGEGEEGKGQ